MEYAIFPHKYFNITQSPYGNPSHCDKSQNVNTPDDQFNENKMIKALDLGGQYGAANNREKFYAPFTCKITRIDTTSTNVVYFVSCDHYGNEKPVILPDGSTSIITMTMAHMSDADLSDMALSVGKVFSAGDFIYREGKKGTAQEHVHMEFARGKQTTKEYIGMNCDLVTGGNRFPLSVSIWPHQVIQKLSNYTVSTLDDSIYTTNTKHKNDFKTTTMIGQSIMTGVYLKAKTTVQVRHYPASGTSLGTLAPGNVVPILRFLGVSNNDNYQWVMIRHTNGVIGYVQLDPKNYAIIDTGTFSPNRTLYLYQDINATLSGFLIRTGKAVTGAAGPVVPKGQRAQVIGILDVQTDGYQWLQVIYNGVTGYVQFDTLKHCRIGV